MVSHPRTQGCVATPVWEPRISQVWHTNLVLSALCGGITPLKCSLQPLNRSLRFHWFWSLFGGGMVQIMWLDRTRVYPLRCPDQPSLLSGIYQSLFPRDWISDLCVYSWPWTLCRAEVSESRTTSQPCICICIRSYFPEMCAGAYTLLLLN